ncbi:ATP-binding protein [Candidatus Woesearchaeota archaeon]|nr:ATP-binding protein [Candidatus Woesearchaeota archaeon]
MIKGLVISGEFGKILIRQKAQCPIELGELLVADDKVLLEVFDLAYGSQISQTNLELMSGLKLEQENDLEVLDAELRQYTLVHAKPMMMLAHAAVCKTLPAFFSPVRDVTKEDLTFLSVPPNPLLFGRIRSGSKIIEVPVYLDGESVFSHHLLISGTTGRGKSVLMNNLLWETIGKDYCGLLVLDPHDEYYGRTRFGLKDHPAQHNVVYYTANRPPPGAKTLRINIRSIKPMHFNGVLVLSDPQQQLLYAYYRKYHQEWIEAIMLEKPLDVVFHEGTLAVVRRILLSLLGLELVHNQLYCHGIFDITAGENTIPDICNELEASRKVIIDTSSFSGQLEILVGSLVATELFHRYKEYKRLGSLGQKPVISIVLEEAPRVLGREVLERGGNIFSTLAREGRKFKVGLTAITQLPSLIPRDILASMNTKIILGIEMAPERQALIDSAAQDLSTAHRTIASLDKGEAIISSSFTKFAIPIKVPPFDDRQREKKNVANDFSFVDPG